MTVSPVSRCILFSIGWLYQYLLEQVILPISPSSGKVQSCEHRHDQVHPIEGQDRLADIDTVEDVPQEETGPFAYSSHSSRAVCLDDPESIVGSHGYR